MKKTMFITSVIMVVVLAIALTTSSLAWFTAGGATYVTASGITLSAASAQAQNGLEISPDSNPANFTTADIALATGTNLVPCCPVAYTVEGEGYVRWTNSDPEHEEDTISISDELFYADLQNMWQGKTAQIAQVEKFQNNTNLVQVSAGSGYYRDTLYLRNSGTKSAIDVACSQANITTSNSVNGSKLALAWVAVFALIPKADAQNHEPDDSEWTPTYNHVLLKLNSSVANNASKMSYSYKGGMTDIDETEATNLKPTDMLHNQPASNVGNKVAIGAFNLTSKSVSLSPATISGGVKTDATPVLIEVYAWYDGQSLDPENRDTTVAIDLRFQIVE